MDQQANIQNAAARFQEQIAEELKRVERMKAAGKAKDFMNLEHIIIGVLPGDGIGPSIMAQALRVLRHLLRHEMADNRISIREIPGMTIERRAELNQSLPDDVLEQILACDVLLKGPMVTPRPGDPWPNLASANTLLRRRLDLYAAVRPIRIPDKGIDWTFFRENIEGEYIWSTGGIQVNDDLAIDFKIQTREGTERIARAALNFARINHKRKLAVVTKSNIIKLVDGNFAKVVHRVAEAEYPEIIVQDKLVDAMAAKMLDPEYNEGMEVIVLPNLYGDIITDIAAEHQGGLGTASSSNLGDQYALFEAIHGTAPYLISHGRGQYADPCSLIRATGQMLGHIAMVDKKEKLEGALDICVMKERKRVITTDKDGATTEEFTDYLLETLQKLDA